MSVLTASGLAGTALAAPVKPPGTSPTRIIAHSDQPLKRITAQPMPAAEPLANATWPAAGETEVVISKASALPRRAGLDEPAFTAAQRAGTLPILVAAEDRARSQDAKVRVKVAAQEISHRAGISGVVVSVAPSSLGKIAVGVDYSGFRNAVGASYASRLRLFALPSCVLTTPEKAECRTKTPLPSKNDPAKQSVTADVDTARTEQVFAVTADSSGAAGSFTASSLSPSGSWGVTGNTGAFTWSYPIELPPAATGKAIAPKVSLSYNSASVDGRTAATNNQSSWLGQGWNYEPGFIERTYRQCADDDKLPETNRTGDMCWAGPIVTMSLNGQSAALVWDEGKKIWRSADDSGARVELVTGATNGAHNGEHWKVTTPDGVRYFFGLNRLPGSSAQDATNSAWTAPVYSPRSGDPCYNSAGFAQSKCDMAWRWQLDYVEDPYGNAAAYYYNTETNQYGANKGTTGVSYIRGGTLKRIDYGLRKVNDSVYGSVAPDQVVFGTSERCTAVDGFDCDPAKFTAANAKYWPDTPQDQQCLPGKSCDNHAPTFWSTKRLTSITTQYNLGSGPVKVDTYELAQQFPGVADKELWLDSITRTGHSTSSTSPAITVPPIKFTGQVYANRVSGFNNQPAMEHWRLTNVTTDTGAIIRVTYSTPDCAIGAMPTDQANNGKRCFPVYWAPPLNENPILDYFHKYVITKVEQQDANALSPTQSTEYTYIGAPAWHFDDNEVVKPKYRTYGQFRGYSEVETRTGDPVITFDGVPDTKTLVRTKYFRGMDGDPLPGGGKRSVSIGSSLGDSITDDDVFAGSPRETQSFNGENGVRLTSAINEPVKVATTATRNRDGLSALTANIVQTGKIRTITDLAAGGTRSSTTTNRYDEHGRLVAKTDSADGVADLCVSTQYADNTTLWIREKVKQVTTSTEACPAGDPTPTKITAAVRTFYDGKDQLGELPGPGNPTRADTATGNNNGTLAFQTTGKAGFDAAGRTTSTTDARNYTTTYTITPSDGGVLSKTVVTNPKGHTESVEVEPSRGQTIGMVDVGGRRTDTVYDALGRLKAAWKPGQVKGSTQASSTFDYLLRTDGPLAITSKALVDHGDGTNYITSVELRDSFGNVRQTQTDAVGGGRVVSEAFYDSHGWKKVTNNRYLTDGAPSTSMVSVGAGEVDDRTVYTYDGSGRATVAAAYKGLTQTWQTRTIYGGDRLTELPPKGGVATTSITDARGRMVELRRYKSLPAVDGNVVSGGSYEAAQYRFNAIGQQDRVTDPAGNVWNYEFDFLGRLHSQIDPDKGTSETEYDIAGLVTSTKNARGQITVYTHDELGRKTAAFDDSTLGHKRTSWTWDGAQNGVGKLFYTTRFTPTGNWLTGVAAYNGRGEPSKQFTQVPSSETGLSGFHETLLGYTSTGQLTMFQPPTAGGLPGEAISVTYDKFGRPNKTSGYNTYVEKSQYTPFGENSQFSLGPNTNQAWLTYDYDAQTRRLTDVNLSAQQALPQIDHMRYSYDAVGNIIKSVNTQGHGETAPVRTQCFSYDPLSRLTGAWTANDNCAGAPSTSKLGNVTPYWTSWTFKPGGLRETQTQHSSSGDTTTSYAYPNPGQPKPHALSSTTTTGPGGTSNTVSYSYDESGNTTIRPGQSLTWDKENRLATVTTTKGVTSYLYDADGGQLFKREPGKATLYLPGQELSRDTSSGVVTGTRYYTHNGVTVAVRVGNTNPKYLVTDQHNTATVAVDAVTFAVTRRTMDPYGNAIGSVEGGTWPDARGFLGKPVSADTGLTDIGARKYDSVTGRFISVDPVLNLSDPDQLCGYTYAENNPVTRSDPSGELTILGVGEAGIQEALGMANDIRITAGRRYLVAHISLQWGYLVVWRQNFIGPQVPIYLPAVLVTIWFSTMPNCPTPQPQSNQPKVGPDPLTRAERVAYNKAHPPIVTRTPKPVKEQIRDLVLALTGVDKMTNCVMTGAVGDCVLGFGPMVVGPLAKGAAALGSRMAGVGGEVALNANRTYGLGNRLPMNMQTVCDTACKYGIDISDLKIKIDKNAYSPEGTTFPNQLIRLRRDAFHNEETLARTLAHERYHVVNQLRAGQKYPKTMEAAEPYEEAAYRFEEQWWHEVGSHVQQGGG